MRRSSSFIAAIAVAALALAPSLADARAGGGSSFGSRAGRTYSAPPSTNTAPYTAAPMERSMTPRAAPSTPGYGSPAPMSPAFGGRSGSGFGSGLLGGLLGVGLGSMLFGGGLFGGSGGLGGMGIISLLLQAALLFFGIRWLVRRFANRQPAMAGGPSFARMQQTSGPAPTGARPAQPSLQIGKPDYEAFDRLLHEVQAAWSAQDLNALRAVATPEMVGYFGEQLAQQASRGVRNTVTHVKLEQGDLSEAWSEGGREYATVAMRFSSLDVTRDSAGRVVDGDVTLRSMATELWTFMRAPGGQWILSAIQQAR